jgi:multidrug efflux pump subunit AcrB
MRTLLVFAAFTLIGLALAPRLSVRYLPAAYTPRLTVSFQWPQATPEAIEQAVTAPLEGAFELVSGVRRLYSVSGHGSGYINIEIDKNANIEYLRFELATRIRQFYPRLPAGVRYPVLEVNRPEDETERPLLTYALSGQAAPHALFDHAREQLAARLALTPGLRRVEVSGGNTLEWRLYYDEERLRALNLSVDQARDALREHLRGDALGIAHDDNGQSAFLRLQPGDEDWKRAPVARRQGRLIRLGELARVELLEQPPSQYYRINGQNSIRLLLFAEQGVNTIQVAEALRRQAERLADNLPPTFQLRLEDDSTEYLRRELRKIRDRTLLSLGILLAFVLLAYRSFRHLVLIVLSLTANLGLAFILYYFLGVELHLYALAGITVSFGIIIDNTIVMAHHLRRQGDRRVFPALLAATLTTLAALALIFFLPERWRINLGEFARVLIINLAVSLLVAWQLIPALLRALAPEARTPRAARVSRAARRQALILRAYERVTRLALRQRKLALTAVVLAFGLPVFWLPNKVEGWNWYNQTLGSDWYIDKAKPLVNKALGGALRLFVYYVYEGSAYREPEETMLYIQGSMPPGSTIEQLNTVFRQVERYLDQFPREIRMYATQVRSGQFAQIQVFFNAAHRDIFPYILRSRMIAYSLNLGGVKWRVYGVGQGFSNESGAMPPRFRIAMYGYNKDELERQAERFAEKLLAHPRVQEVNTEANINWWEKDRFQYEMEFDRQTLAIQGLTPARLARELAPFNQALRHDFSLPDGRPLRFISESLPDNDLWRLRHFQLNVDSARALVGRLARIEQQKVASALHKENQQYIRMVEFEYTGSFRFGSRFLDEVMAQMQREMPLGYSMERKEFSFSREQKRMYHLLGLVFVLIFWICAITFESLRQALAVMLLIPVSFIGIFLTFYYFDFPFDQGGYTSFVLVSGLTVNGLILILNEYNGLRRQNGMVRAASKAERAAQRFENDLRLYLKAYRRKILPVLLTILSTALGMIPFLIHGRKEVFWFALAAGAIGGLVFSVLVITLVIPLLFVRGRPHKEK